MASAGITCQDIAVSVDTAGFTALRADRGRNGGGVLQVSWSDLTIPGWPGEQGHSSQRRITVGHPKDRDMTAMSWWEARWSRLRNRELRGESGEGGGISFLMLGAAVALLMVLGLVLDGSTKAHALDRANQLAYEAARAGLQTVNPSASRVDVVVVDAAVAKYLAAHGVSGTAAIADQQVIVEVTITEPTKMLVHGRHRFDDGDGTWHRQPVVRAIGR